MSCPAAPAYLGNRNGKPACGDRHIEDGELQVTKIDRPDRPASNKRSKRGRTVMRAVTVENYPDLVAAYGEHFANEVVDAVARQIEAIALDGVQQLQVDASQNPLSVQLTLHTSTELDMMAVDETILVAATSLPVVIDGIGALPRVTIGHADASLRNNATGAHKANRPGLGPGSRRGYAACMEDAVRCHDALAAGHMALFAQPVKAANGSGVLYRECLARKADLASGNIQALPCHFIPALEKLGMTRGFDRLMVRKTIDLLRQVRSVRLGCNISALSATNDAWWSSTFQMLKASPSLASRLVIELTETAECPDMDEAIAFCEALRSFGCKVAVDDFGAGFSSMGFALRVKPDIVKVDVTIIRETRHSGGIPLLRNLLDLLGNIAAEVIVEGIESDDDARMAIEAGARWLQGYHVEGVSASAIDRAWLRPDYAVMLEKLRNIASVASTATTPGERLSEFIAMARDVIEDRSIGLDALEARAIVECYSEELHRGISGLPQLRNDPPNPSRAAARGFLDEAVKASIKAIGKQHGGTFRAQWIKTRSTLD